mmetsp:Transcript_105167/g.145468  ORF Transcript_105167/g.145468 Transcript_105167/m.145468 type:complete len:143 (-) Transcript_105167:280-708(-)
MAPPMKNRLRSWMGLRRHTHILQETQLLQKRGMRLGRLRLLLTKLKTLARALGAALMLRPGMGGTRINPFSWLLVCYFSRRLDDRMSCVVTCYLFSASSLFSVIRYFYFRILRMMFSCVVPSCPPLYCLPLRLSKCQIAAAV